MGVGKKYPGSTGGEIFNYYVVDADANIASGDYSTVHGQQNSADGQYSFIAGYQNTIAGRRSYVLGDKNTTATGAQDNQIIGYNNDLKKAQSAIVVGKNTVVQGSGAHTPNNIIIVGHGNRLLNHGGTNDTMYQLLCGIHLTPLDHKSDVIIYGIYNQTSNYCKLTNPKVVIGAGTGYNYLDAKNAIEINNTDCKIINNLQLNADTTAVNAITPPADPSNPTADEKTLATKAYVASQVPSLAALEGITFKRSETAVSGQLTALTPETAYDLESTFSITIPSWASHMYIGYDINGTQGYTRLAIGISGNYSVVVEHGTELDSCELEWTPLTKELTPHTIYVWTGTTPSASTYDFNILSIRFEGDYTPYPVSP